MTETRPTSADVAREAGVSRATVSYVLNGAARNISAETQARVKDAATRLGYISHGPAKTLKVGYSDVVLLAIPPWPLGPPVAEWISTASRAIGELGYTPLIHHEQEHSPADLARICQAIRPVGVIAPSSHFRPGILAEVRASGARAVIAYGEQQVPNVPTLVGPQEEVGACAARYLAQRGHREILALMPADKDLVDLGLRRSAGAAAACQEHGITYRAITSQIEMRAVAAALRQAMPNGRWPSAIFAFNDECALMAIRCLAAADIRVPVDIAVLGCDNSPMARLTEPPLTSVKFRITESWQNLIESLGRMIDGEELPAVMNGMDVTIAVRQSA